MMPVWEYVEIIRCLSEGMELFRRVNESYDDDAVFMGEFMGVLIREKGSDEEIIQYMPWDELTSIMRSEFLAALVHLRQLEAAENE
ncbi:MAG: hypothetical protein Q8N08_05765 [Methanobacteriaceae archaeon]|nr:hypothetical protein [Methanobacteriaceae archaeon]